jgi:hypothetical protein
MRRERRRWSPPCRTRSSAETLHQARPARRDRCGRREAAKARRAAAASSSPLTPSLAAATRCADPFSSLPAVQNQAPNPNWWSNRLDKDSECKFFFIVSPECCWRWSWVQSVSFLINSPVVQSVVSEKLIVSFHCRWLQLNQTYLLMSARVFFTSLWCEC